MSTPKWAVGMRKLGAGVYVDAAGVPHIDPAEICEYLGAPVTEANCRIAEDTAIAAFRSQYGPTFTVVEVMDDEPTKGKA